MLAKKSSKNQITLPKAIVAAIEEVDYFDITTHNGRIILEPVQMKKGAARCVPGSNHWVSVKRILMRLSNMRAARHGAIQTQWYQRLFRHSKLSWLRDHWRSNDFVILVSKATVEELIRVTYPKFDLDKVDIEALLAEYLPFTEAACNHNHRSAATLMIRCSSTLPSRADVLVTGDRALLAMDFGVIIEKAADYKQNETGQVLT